MRWPLITFFQCMQQTQVSVYRTIGPLVYIILVDKQTSEFIRTLTVEAVLSLSVSLSLPLSLSLFSFLSIMIP